MSKQDAVTITSIKRRGWLTWEVHWSLSIWTSGVIVGSPGYILRRLLMWAEPVGED